MVDYYSLKEEEAWLEKAIRERIQVLFYSILLHLLHLFHVDLQYIASSRTIVVLYWYSVCSY